MKKVFQASQFKADDLLDYCSRLKAMGDVVSILGFYANKNQDQTFEWVGERLGHIISDYAEVLGGALSHAYWALDKVFDPKNGSEKQGAFEKVGDQTETPNADPEKRRL